MRKRKQITSFKMGIIRLYKAGVIRRCIMSSCSFFNYKPEKWKSCT